VQLLLDYNASVTTRTTVARNSVMHFAAKNGSEAVIKLLMERDATLLDSPNKNLDTPLMMAVLARNYMAARCGSPHRPPQQQRPGTHGPCRQPKLMAHPTLSRIHSCILKYSTRSLDFQNKSLNTALHLAAKIGHLRLVKLLMGYGANVTLRWATMSRVNHVPGHAKAEWKFSSTTSGKKAYTIEPGNLESPHASRATLVDSPAGNMRCLQE
jgi:ankyrin repeat protein